MVPSATHFAGFGVVEDECLGFGLWTLLGVGFTCAGFSGVGVVGTTLASGIMTAGAGAVVGVTLQKKEKHG